MHKYRKVEGLFEELKKHIVGSRAKNEKPSDDTYHIDAVTVYTLDDGTELELCFWTDHEIHMSFWDVSVEKEQLERMGITNIEAYLKEKGLYLEDVEDKYGRWHYGKVSAHDEFYRLQYADMDFDCVL